MSRVEGELGKEEEAARLRFCNDGEAKNNLDKDRDSDSSATYARATDHNDGDGTGTRDLSPDLTHLDIRVKVMYAAMNTHVQNIASTIRVL
jgi:hypothetical protein